MKNFLTATLLSVGTPMLNMGDEVRRTQAGNNNSYCQDNETSWFDWSLVTANSHLLRFTKLLIARRQLRALAAEQQRLTLNEVLAGVKLHWHGAKLDAPDWSDASRTLSFTAEVPGDNLLVHFIFNAYWEAISFELPQPPRGTWLRWIDTAAPAPQDIYPWQEAPAFHETTYLAQPRSTVVLYATPHPQERSTYVEAG
jgi:glycogen operon protein